MCNRFALSPRQRSWGDRGVREYWLGDLRPRLIAVVLLSLFMALPLVLLLFVAQSSRDGTIRLDVSTLLLAVGAYVLAAMLTMRFGLGRLSRLEALGMTDSLSNVGNRRALHRDIQRSAAPEDEIAVGMVDLDGFKAVNDQYGHNVGDRLIKECARIVGDICGKDARRYRLGGDEFAIVVLGPAAANILEGICRKIISRLETPVQIDDRQIKLGASFGMARGTRDFPLGSSELLRRSDVAMYVSKEQGKGRCTWFREEFDQQREESKQIEADLRRALDRGEFHLAYQPLVDANSSAIVAVEALIRWNRPDGLKIGPDVFIPIAEESGLIGPIGLWVLRRGCEDALPWSTVKLSVNVSAAQLRNPEFPIQLGHILEETGFPASRLELEITETYLVGDPTVAGRSLEMIRSFGVGVVLDDFGTGYASIGFLRKFRFEKLKLDRSLVVESSTDMGSRAMLVSSIAVARAMDMDVTAEGIETEDQADMVRAAGCDQMQGWLYYKAIPANEIDAIVNDAPLRLTATAC
jgi:diguanylate cyclase (GGDEF)-like protein